MNRADQMELFLITTQEHFWHVTNGQSRVFYILKEFGHLINRLHVTLITESYEISNELAYYVNRYCPMAILKVTFHQGYSIPDVPFINASSVVLLPPASLDALATHQTQTKKSIDLNQIFPRMQRLKVTTIDAFTLNRQFSHLIDFEFQSIFDDTENLTEIMRLNPQIHHFNPVIFWNLAHLTKVNEMLPKLKSLYLKFPADATAQMSLTKNPVYFKNVQRFSLDLLRLAAHEIDENLQNCLMAIDFERLKVFKLISMHVSSIDFQLQLIIKNKELHTVEIEHLQLTSTKMLQITMELRKLQKLRVDCLSLESADEVQRFLKESVTLKTVEVVTTRDCFKQLKRIEKDLSAKWTLSVDGKVFNYTSK